MEVMATLVKPNFALLKNIGSDYFVYLFLSQLQFICSFSCSLDATLLHTLFNILIDMLNCKNNYYYDDVLQLPLYHKKLSQT